MSALLTQYFERYAEEAITKMKAGVLAVSYYQRILARLLKQEDLSGELAIIARVGPAGRSGSVCLNNFPRTISGALGVHNGAELSTAAVGACDVPADAVGNSGRTSKSHSMQPLPVLAG